MTQFLALLRLQLLSRYADLKPKNLKNALKEKRGRTIGMFIAILFLVVYLGVILYIIETKALEFLMSANIPDVLLSMAVVLSTAGTLVMAFFFIMSALYLGRDTVFLASMPIKPRTLLGAKLTQVWISETLIDAVIILPACILYGTRVGVTADFYLRMVVVWLLIAVLPICIAAFLSAVLIRLSALWKHREIIMTVGGIALFIAYMFLMMNVGSITGDSAEGGEMIQKFFMDNSTRISSLTALFPPAQWAVKGLMGDWGQLALFAVVSLAAAALLVWIMRKGIQKGSIREGNAFMANVKREILSIIRVPSYAVNILPITFMPLVMVIMMGVMIGRSGGDGETTAQLFEQIGNRAIVMCILAAVVSYMAGMNPALSTAVTREGKGHDFIKALPVSGRTLVHAKLAVGFGLVLIGVAAACIAILVLVPGFGLETLLAMLLCLVFCFASACLALSRDVKKPRLDWVTEQEAVKQNFGVMISMLISWAVLALLALISYLMLNAGWTTLPVFAVLMAILLALAFAAYRVLMKNTDKYYCAG